MHLAGVLNHRADYLSRNVDPKSYSLDLGLFRRVRRMFQYVPTLDAFASSVNAKCARYWSWRMDRKFLEDGLKLSWATERSF